MTKENKTEMFIDTTVVAEKVPIFRPVVNLLTLESHGDRKNIANTLKGIADALSDDNFSKAVLAKIVLALQTENEKERKKALKDIQRHCSYSDFKTIRRILDDKRCAYDLRDQAVGWKYVRARARCYNLRDKPSGKRDEKPIKRKNPLLLKKIGQKGTEL